MGKDSCLSETIKFVMINTKVKIQQAYNYLVLFPRDISSKCYLQIISFPKIPLVIKSEYIINGL